MHKAYRATQLLKLALGVESIKATGEHLLIGTKQGHLLMYSVAFNNLEDDESNENAVRVQLLRSNKSFSKKPILQLDVVPEYSILVALSDSMITVHDIDLSVTSFPVITNLPRTKGATTFALDVSRLKSLSGETVCTVRLVVAVRRKLQLYYYKHRKFEDFQPDINLPDVPKSLAWCKDTICIGYRSEYGMVKLDTSSGTYSQLFPTGKNQDCSVTLTVDNRFALGKDDQTTFVDLTGKPALETVTWSSIPTSIAHDPPYLISTLNDTVEVRTENPKMVIQSIDLQRALYISTVPGKPGVVYVASSSHIWCLKMASISSQINFLLKEKQFELALTLTKSEKSEDKATRLQKIEILHAFDLFCNMKFKEAMDVFFKLDVDPSHVVGLYSDLLPSEFRNKLKFPDKVPKFHGQAETILESHKALIDYLTEVRNKLQGCTAKTYTTIPLAEAEKKAIISSKKQFMNIIDTTLLKCYLKINNALVAPLLRMKNNHCHPEETERALKKSHKYAELLIFYNTKDKHKDALKLLQEQSDKVDSPLFGTAKTVQYLQNLGPDQINLVCDYAGPVLDKLSDEDGLLLFTDDHGEVENWPRGIILDFLMKNCSSIVIPYLEHIITNWNDTTNVFHNNLILRYQDFLVDLFKEVESEERSEKVSKTRSKLKELLHTSQFYNADVILTQWKAIGQDRLDEERALLLGSMGRHKDALVLLLFQVQNLTEALAYCEKYYSEGSSVYTIFYELLVRPPDSLELQKMYVSRENAQADHQADTKTALTVLQDHGSKIDLKTVLSATPSNVSLSDLIEYLDKTIGSRVTNRHQMQLLRGLMHAEHLQVQEERIRVESQKIVLEEIDVCPVCSRRFVTGGMIVRFPNGQIVHAMCQDLYIRMSSPR